MSNDPWIGVKSRDPYTFKKAEDFFRDLDNDEDGTRRPSTISCLKEDNDANPVSSHGRVFRFDDDSLLLIQFMRPRVWTIRFGHDNRAGTDFSDFNTRTIIADTLTEMIQVLDEREGIQWKVQLIEDPQYYILQSLVEKDDGTREPGVQLWIQRHPFQITAIRTVETMPPIYQSLGIQDPENFSKASAALHLQTQPGIHCASIWQTKERPLKYNGEATLFSVNKTITADFTGFGEHGGKGFFTKKTYLNYFNFDNMKYENVYGNGPLESREPLYHSEPYWLEVDGLPSCKSLVATFIDNYSHVCIDIGMTNDTTIRMATRFNSFAAIFVAGNNISEIIQSYTSVLGHPRLKPRYVLGNHQGGYGYDTKEMVLEVANKYKQCGIPLDGLHVDVDIQQDYRTFTIDTREGHFPQPDEMFAALRKLGVKCCTNITPYISSAPNDEFGEYQTYEEGLAKNRFIMDDRDVDPSAPDAENIRYQQWGNGTMYFTNPTGPGHENPDVVGPNYWVPDNYKFAEVYNSKTKPFHGGIYYGWKNGHPGHYPNLNKKEVREWWGKQYQYLFEMGLDFVWQDMTSPCIAEEYGDMKSLPFRLLLDSDGRKDDPKGVGKKRAIEIWHLYSYNLHKATYHGLNSLHDTNKDKLGWRENRRNFIIGRGSFAGMHRYAGLWTGDNASTWEFLDISVAQVLAIGLSGITIAGADVGGFEFMSEDTKAWADPELLIRWYCAYSLLPWFRNHYTKYRDWFDGPHKGQMRKDGKEFQEPYMYSEHPDVPHDQMVYKSVLPICKYLIRLRYSLLQLSYDAMFENMLTGLPIARAMIITDEQDRSLFSNDAQHFTRSQYFLRNDLLVAPALRKESERPLRRVYLPYPDAWYTMNLRPDEELGVALGPKTEGGSRINYDCHISDDADHIPYVNPMYIREGAIIPKIEVRDYVPDPSLPPQPPNPITIHVYPGKNNSYEMFLDDGISRDSAPDNEFLASSLTTKNGPSLNNAIANGNGATVKNNGKPAGRGVDEKAASKFSKVVIEQKSSKRAQENDDGSISYIHFSRTVSITCPHDGFKDGLANTIGSEYTIVFWHDAETPIKLIQGKYSVLGQSASNKYETSEKARATRVRVPVDDAHHGVEIELWWDVLIRGKVASGCSRKSP